MVAKQIQQGGFIRVPGTSQKGFVRVPGTSQKNRKVGRGQTPGETRLS